MKELSEKQKKFCEEYVIDLNATQAAIRAGYSEKTAQEQSSRLLSKVMVKDEIERLRGKQSEESGVKAADVLKELARIGFSDPRSIIADSTGGVIDPKEWSDDVAHSISSIEVFEEFQGAGKDRQFIGYTKKVKFWDKPKALDLIGRHLKMFIDQMQFPDKNGNPTEFSEIIRTIVDGSKK